MELPALVVPPLTPFTPDQQVDVDALRAGVEYVISECGASMVVAAGVEAQEYQYLTPAERLALIDRTIEFVDGRRPVAVGISHPSFRQTIDLAHHAEDRGAQVVQLLAPLRPIGGQPTTVDLVRYFEAVVAETNLPVMLYLNPSSGADVSVSATIELAQIDGIEYIKESSRDLSRVSRLIEDIDVAGSARYFTTMQMLLISLQLGGSGVTLPPPAAKLAAAIVRSYTAGDLADAARLQRQFALYPSRWMHRGLVTVMKASMELLGVPAGGPYPPYPPIHGDELEALRSYLATTDLAPDLAPDLATVELAADRVTR
jgi:4-hydroxy-tetrahydrodipicolinate synthase